MDAAGLAHLEQACLHFYEGTDQVARNAAQQVLMSFGNDPAVVTKCRQIFDQSKSPYATTLAASTLTKAISSPTCALTLNERVMIRNYALEYMANNTFLPHFTSAELCRLICKVAKLGWFESDGAENFPMRDIKDNLERFISGSIPHCLIGVQLFERLVSEMNEPSAEQGLAKHRKIMNAFRDDQLFSIFELSLDLLNKFSQNLIPVTDPVQRGTLAERLLALAKSCLSFDFLGTNTDDSTDDTRTAHLPSNWRDRVVAPETMGLFINLYMNLEAPLSASALTCVVQLASTRRTLFSNVQRIEYLTRLVGYINTIFRSARGLDSADNYHEFCRLLARLKTNFQLSELVTVEGYAEVIERAANFTVQSLSSIHLTMNSIHYLLSLWDRMISSIPYVKSDRSHGLEVHAPTIAITYVETRLASVEAVLAGTMEDPLDDIDVLEIQIKQIAVIARCQFDKTCQYLVTRFDPIAKAYNDAVTTASRDPASQHRLKVLDGQLTWMMFILGSVIGTRTQISPSEAYDGFDAELICRGLQLMRILDERLGRGPSESESLDLAILNFLQHFRMSFIGDSVPRHGRLYTRLQEAVGVKDEAMILDVLVNKIATNLQYRTGSNMIITQTLKLLSDLCLGYSSLRRLVVSERIQFVLANHSSEHFPFLDACEDTRHRTTFYSALGRIIGSETTESDSTKFNMFLAPLTRTLEALKHQMSSGISAHSAAGVRKAIVGVARDVRGILQSLTSKPSYALIFDWLYPDYVSVLISGVQMWYNDPAAAVPLLKCMTELVTNKNSRLQMHTSSPKGILLFRETSKMMVAYGERIVTISGVDPSQVYTLKYKGITAIFNMFKCALVGDYVNFGVFELYGDDALNRAFEIFFNLLVSVPHVDLIAYPKLCKAYYATLVAISRDHVPYLSRLDPHFFGYISGSLLEGIKSTDVQICTQCCTSLDYLMTFTIVGLSKTKKDPAAVSLSQHFALNQDFLGQTLHYLFNLVMFEDCKNQWSVSRPLLGLLILQPAQFEAVRGKLIASLPSHKQPTYVTYFTALMTGVEENLTTKNRDKFTQNLAVFRRDINNFVKSAAAAGAAAQFGGGMSASSSMIGATAGTEAGGGTSMMD